MGDGHFLLISALAELS